MLEKVYQDRLAKLEKIRQLGFDPYGGRYDSAERIADILGRYQDNVEGQRADAAGRLILYRAMGKLIFAHIRDESGAIQIALRRDALDAKQWELAKLLDLGDIVAAAGPLAKTKTGELTIFAEKLTLLAKSLLPMPEKFHGLVDTETRYRQRYLDLMANPESLERFKNRIKIIDSFRRGLSARGFVEVETPVLQSIYGGAAARPFTTHHNTLDCELFLRISPELYLKRLLVGGMNRVYEFSRVFRNEGVDTRHNPEFTLLELYQAYADYRVMMEITEELVSGAASQVHAELLKEAEAIERAVEQRAELPRASFDPSLAFQLLRYAEQGKTTLPYGDRLIDFTPPWLRRTYDELLRDFAGVSMFDAPAARARAAQLGVDVANKADAVVVNGLFERLVEPELAKTAFPVFVTDYPAELCPLTRRKADDPRIAERFECFVAGMEIANAYTELNDPAVQEANLRQQLAGEAEGETMRVMDEDFIAALRHGMPPAGGLGIGMDRVIMLLTNRQSIRDVILFPLLRPT